MKDIPSHLQCAYCERNRDRGGECNGEEKGCLFFKADKRGCIRNANLELPVRVYDEAPLINKWYDGYELFGVDTEIRVRRIFGFKWDERKGFMYIYCDCDYFVNEFHEDYKEPSKKPNLIVIKGGR